MEKEKFFRNENTAAPQPWISTNFGMEMNSDQIPNCFFNPNWENSMDQSDPFESALSSIVSSPVAYNAKTMLGNGGGGDGVMMRELIGRLGSICNSGEISPQSYIGPNENNTSTHKSCYSTPLNSPPKLNLIETQIMGNFPIPENHLGLPSHPNLSPISADPGFVERAARFSCFGGRNLFGLNETELPHRLNPRTESDKLSRVSSNQSLKISGSTMGVPESKKSATQMGNSGSDKKFSTEKAELGDSREGSSVSEQIPVGDLSMKSQNDSNARKRKSIPRGKAKESLASDAKVESENNESNTKKRKTDEAADATNGSAKNAGDGNQMQNKDNSKPPEPPKDYIHVRARRGQATDSHSLAERVRREKISERMKFLQDLVPGCNKVTGKAVMLDEIINYVQSLQRQVEFLSMKLATVNPRIDSNMEALLSKDIFQSRGPSPHTLYQLDSTMSAFPYGLVPQQAPPLHNSVSNGVETQFSVNPLNAALRRNPIDGFVEAAPQVSAFWEDGLESVVQMGFGQNQQQGFQGGSIAAAQMKVEL